MRLVQLLLSKSNVDSYVFIFFRFVVVVFKKWNAIEFVDVIIIIIVVVVIVVVFLGLAVFVIGIYVVEGGGMKEEGRSLVVRIRNQSSIHLDDGAIGQHLRYNIDYYWQHGITNNANLPVPCK